jgi:aminobenzoyl-glutamate utilization protein B
VNLAFGERFSAKLLSDFLEREGFALERGIAGDETAFVATFTHGKGPVISFNAVMSEDEFVLTPGIRRTPRN